MPEAFHGLSSEGAEGLFTTLVRLQKIKLVQAVWGVIPLLMKDEARHWFEVLNERRKDTLEHFVKVFREHFKRDTAITWKDAAAVWTTAQKPGHSVEAYFSDFEQKVLRANMSEEQLRFCIMASDKVFELKFFSMNQKWSVR